MKSLVSIMGAPALLIVGVFFLVTSGLSHAQSRTITADYFGIHIFYGGGPTVTPRTGATIIPGGIFGSWRLWTANKSRWLDIEPTAPKDANFGATDIYIALASKKEMGVLWTLGVTPPWASRDKYSKGEWGSGTASPPSQDDDWSNYVKDILTRYRGKISALEIWNEPDTTDVIGKGNTFAGTMQDLVALTCLTYKSAKEVAPGVQVVSPSFTGDKQVDIRLEAFLRLGGGKCVDVIGFHSYEYDGSGPRYLMNQVLRIKRIATRYGAGKLPIWNTEFGLVTQNDLGMVKPLDKWGGLNKVHDPLNAAVLATQYLTFGALAGLERFYWFALDSGSMGLMNRGRNQLNLVGRSIAALAHWLEGTQIEKCEAFDSGRAERCFVSRNGKEIGSVLWATGKVRLRSGVIAESIAGDSLSGPSIIDSNGLPYFLRGDSSSSLLELVE